jgi:nicotinamide mononucleotide (NMN) deamidase PncC
MEYPMNWREKLKHANVNIHLVATGGGAGFQNELWAEPGSSAYLSGASFPYSPEEQEELLGFMPEHFCSKENAIDLASAAYMKAYKFGGKDPVGLAITASVASEKEHRGEHRAYTCIMTKDKVLTTHHTMVKGTGVCQRGRDGTDCDALTFFTLLDGLGIATCDTGQPEYEDATALAKERFFLRPYFTEGGQRLARIPSIKSDGDYRHDPFVLMPGAFNPPHEGHFGTAAHVLREYGKQTIFELTAEPPHKDWLTVQELLQRAKLLQGHHRIFTRKEPYYIDKARAFPGMGMVLGADAMVRILDPKWGLNFDEMFKEMDQLRTKLYIGGRDINGKFTTRNDIEDLMTPWQAFMFRSLSLQVGGEYHVSSTEIRNKLL